MAQCVAFRFRARLLRTVAALAVGKAATDGSGWVMERLEARRGSGLSFAHRAGGGVRRTFRAAQPALDVQTRLEELFLHRPALQVNRATAEALYALQTRLSVGVGFSPTVPAACSKEK